MESVACQLYYCYYALRSSNVCIALSREANISRSTIDKMEKDEPVKAELAVRACRVLSQHLGYEVTYQSLHIKVIS